MIRFEVPGAPRGKGRHRTTVVMRNGRPVIGAGGRPIMSAYTDEKTANYESLIALCCQQAMAGRPPSTAGIRLVLDIRLPIAKSWSDKKQRAALAGGILATVKPDADNVEKAVKDGCNRIAWADDCQVIETTKRKRYSDTPGVTVDITELPGEPA